MSWPMVASPDWCGSPSFFDHGVVVAIRPSWKAGSAWRRMPSAPRSIAPTPALSAEPAPGIGTAPIAPVIAPSNIAALSGPIGVGGRQDVARHGGVFGPRPHGFPHALGALDRNARPLRGFADALLEAFGQ